MSSSINRRCVRSLQVVLLAVLASCATQATGSGISTGTSRDVISFEEIQAAKAPNVYTLVQRLRPNFFSRNHGMSSLGNTEANTLLVYVNDARIGDTDALRQLSTDGVLTVEYLNGSAAQLRYGAGHSGGVILVTRR